MQTLKKILESDFSHLITLLIEDCYYSFCLGMYVYIYPLKVYCKPGHAKNKVCHLYSSSVLYKMYTTEERYSGKRYPNVI